MNPNRLFSACFAFCFIFVLGGGAAEPGVFKFTIKNGGMTQGDDVPADWAKGYSVFAKALQPLMMEMLGE